MNQEDKELQEMVTDEIRDILPDYSDDTFKGIDITPQECMFAYHLLESNNATTSYQSAFGADYKKAMVNGKRLEKKPCIQEALKVLRDKVWQSAMETLPLRLLSDLEAVRTTNLADYYKNERAIPFDMLDEKHQRMITDIEYIINPKTGEILVKYKFGNRDSVYSKYLELIKLYKETNTGKEDISSDKEAREKIAEIFGKKPT